MSEPRLDPRESTKLALALLSRGVCQFKGCGASLVVNGVIVGQIAHIRAVSTNGPRYDPDLSPDDARSLPNLMYLCATHHAIVDKAASDYDVETLTRMKADHEKGDFMVTADMLLSLVQAIERPVPKRWWYRPGAPQFQISPSTSKPAQGPWKFEISWVQNGGEDIGQPEYRVLLGGEWSAWAQPKRRNDRQWRLPDLTFTPKGEPFALEFRFWWDGAERLVTYRWKSESQFQNIATDEVVEYG